MATQLKLEFLTRAECNPAAGGTSCGDEASTAISAAQRGGQGGDPEASEEHDLSPTLFYTWQKQFFENGAAAFAKDTIAEQRELERKVEDLRQRLGQKDRVIAKVKLSSEVVDERERRRTLLGKLRS